MTRSDLIPYRFYVVLALQNLYLIWTVFASDMRPLSFLYRSTQVIFEKEWLIGT
jgi:hypothetical protein